MYLEIKGLHDWKSFFLNKKYTLIAFPCVFGHVSKVKSMFYGVIFVLKLIYWIFTHTILNNSPTSPSCH